MAARPKLLHSEPPADVADDDTIAADELAAAARTRNVRPPASSPAPTPPERPLKSVPTPSSSKKRAPRSSSSASRPSAGVLESGPAHDGAGLVLGMVTYALFLAYLNGGWSGVRQWLSAKFLNRTPAPRQTPAPVDPRQSTPQTGGGGGPGIFNITPPPGSDGLPN